MFTSPLVVLIAVLLCLVVFPFKLLSLHKYLLFPGRLGSGLGCHPNSDIMQMIIISALCYPPVMLLLCSCFCTELKHKAGGAGTWIELPESLWVLWRCQKRIGRWGFTCSEAARRRVEGRSCIVLNQWETHSNHGLDILTLWCLCLGIASTPSDNGQPVRAQLRAITLPAGQISPILCDDNVAVHSWVTLLPNTASNFTWI